MSRKSAAIVILILGLGYLLEESRKLGWHDPMLTTDVEETICDGLGILVISIGLLAYHWKD